MGMTVDAALAKLRAEDAIGQLRRREGLMRTLGSEGNDPKLDWVEGVQRLLQDPAGLEKLEQEARAIQERGIRHVIWSGMGGSVMAVRVLTDLGFCRYGSSNEGVVIYPLDSTDPAALNTLVREIAATKQIPLTEIKPDRQTLQALLGDVMMVGVSMGMTSEEPITHLNWFAELLAQAELTPAEHLLVMTLPGSYLDQFAHEQHVPSWPLQLDGGTGTGGRMSAPATQVFLLPAALYLTGNSSTRGGLRAVLQRAWAVYNLDLATTRPEEHPFVRLAAALSEASQEGVCQLLLRLPGEWQALVQWIEQLLEESLGKGGKGIVVFEEQPLPEEANEARGSGRLIVQATTMQGIAMRRGVYRLHLPMYATKDPVERLVALAASFLNWQLCMAVYGYLEQITFAGQPAVENYKARARKLRFESEPLRVLSEWAARSMGKGLTLLLPEQVTVQASPAVTFADWLVETISADMKSGARSYLDYTFNGEATPALTELLAGSGLLIGNQLLGIPLKLRRAPAAYHASEQSEMDGPASLVSLRVFTRKHQRAQLGMYDDTFLLAQAISTWQAMLEQGRPCALLALDGTADEAQPVLLSFLTEVVERLRERLSQV